MRLPDNTNAGPATSTRRRIGLLLVAMLLATAPAVAQSGIPGLSIQVGGMENEGFWGAAIQLVILMTLLSLAPAMLILATSFTRIVIVLGFIRTALGVNQAPSNQIIIGLSIFLTIFIMKPVGTEIHDHALAPYKAGEMTGEQAIQHSVDSVKTFMLKQTNDTDLEFFLGIAQKEPTLRSELPIEIVLPSYVIGELRTAFEMGFLVFIPFLIIDFVVASTLMSMGMMMMPPVMISLPFKLLLFVLIDGWSLIVGSLVKSFA